jgi:arabinan endo-1,5-alpha-L-arabinosidase
MRKPSFQAIALVQGLLLCLIFVTSCGASTTAKKGQSAVPTATPITLQGNLAAHDPSMVKAGNTYYVFSTGGGLGIRTSTDLINWTLQRSVFESVPDWVSTSVGATVTDLWAPDISYHNGTYYLYYAGSQFGKNTSVIGLATNTTLDNSSANYKWVDHGLVIQTGTTDDFNAIDPNLTFDADGQPWLALGSWWTGLKLAKLDPSTFKLASSSEKIYSLASNYAASGAIEASYLIYRNGYYYLFASIDLCCRGADSTYKTVVGRSSTITGPYSNEDGTMMGDQAQFTILLQGADSNASSAGGATNTQPSNVRGPGGESIYRDGSTDLIIYHYYDADEGGAIKFSIRKLVWNKGWPTVGAQYVG